ncbi:MAG: AfsR/SARP family transcriptional regulator, partial [Caldilineaceae bacterium]
MFGKFALTGQGVPVKFATDHARALLAYLAVEPGAHDRSTLAALLWPEQPENTARQSLRQALLHLKQGMR